jgi:hypothetical protein
MRTTIDFSDPADLYAHLEDELREWTAAGWFTAARAERFHRRAKLLARLTGTTHEAVVENLSDALACA